MRKQKKLSKIEKRILGELDENARKPYSQIAKKLGLSLQLVKYKIEALKKKNILYGFTTLIDPTVFGYAWYRMMIRLSNFSKEKYEELILYLMEHPNVIYIAECGGNWDLMVTFMADHVVKFNRNMFELVDKFPKQIQNYNVLTVIELIYCGRKYLNQSERNSSNMPHWGNDLKSANYDKLDLKIIKELSENARMSILEIGRKNDINPSTISYRMKKMQDKKIILGFTPLIHLDSIVYSAYKALIKFQNITEKKKNEIINYLKVHENVIACEKLIGEWDFEIEFELESIKDSQELIRNFRDNFQDSVNSTIVIPVFRDYKYNFLPKGIK